MAPGGSRNQSGKDLPLMAIARRKYFRVPLHAEDKAMTGALDAFDDAIARGGVDDQSAA